MADSTSHMARIDLKEAWFQPMGFHMRVITDHSAIIAAVEASFRGFGAARHVPTPDVTLRLFAHEVGDDELQESGFQIEGPIIYCTSGHASTLVADREKRLAWGFFSPQVLAQPTFFRNHFLEPAFHVMIQPLGLMPIHAAACVKNGRALLFRAPSGGGKTTLAYAGARRRFQALAEDSVCIDVENHIWWGLPWRFHFLPDACGLFPELATSTSAMNVQGQTRLEVELETIRPGSTTACARPGPVVILRRLPRGRSLLTRLDFADVKGLWFQEWSGNETEFFGYERYVDELLRHDTYRLDLGDDIEQGLDLLEPLFDV